MGQKEKLAAINVFFAIICITIIEIIAINHGIDGKFLTFTCTLIAGLAGYNFKQIIERFFRK